MQVPIQITFRDMPPSDAVDAHIREEAEKLESASTRLVACRVAIESPHKHKRTGRHFRVRIEVTVPGADVVVSHASDDDTSNEDVYVAVDHAFACVMRKIEDRTRRLRSDVRAHDDGYRDGRVAKIWTYEGFGFVETLDGNEVYFHRNSVLDHAFDRLAVGSMVRFIEELGEKGPQASTVALVGLPPA